MDGVLLLDIESNTVHSFVSFVTVYGLKEKDKKIDVFCVRFHCIIVGSGSDSPREVWHPCGCVQFRHFGVGNIHTWNSFWRYLFCIFRHLSSDKKGSWAGGGGGLCQRCQKWYLVCRRSIHSDWLVGWMTCMSLPCCDFTHTHIQDFHRYKPPLLQPVITRARSSQSILRNHLPFSSESVGGMSVLVFCFDRGNLVFGCSLTFGSYVPVLQLCSLPCIVVHLFWSQVWKRRIGLLLQKSVR